MVLIKRDTFAPRLIGQALQNELSIATVDKAIRIYSIGTI